MWLSDRGLSSASAALIQAYGARLLITARDDRSAIMREVVRDRGWFPATNCTALPTNGRYGHEAHKTNAYELHQQLNGGVPDLVVAPTVDGEAVFGIWKGFHELQKLGRILRGP